MSQMELKLQVQMLTQYSTVKERRQQARIVQQNQEVRILITVNLRALPTRKNTLKQTQLKERPLKQILE